MTPDTRLGLLEVAEGQPLYLKLIRALLEAAGDPDRDFLPVGILDPLPRTPHVFEEQLKVATGERSLGGRASLGSQLLLCRGTPGVR